MFVALFDGNFAWILHLFATLFFLALARREVSHRRLLEERLVQHLAVSFRRFDLCQVLFFDLDLCLGVQVRDELLAQFLVVRFVEFLVYFVEVVCEKIFVGDKFEDVVC